MRTYVLLLLVVASGHVLSGQPNDHGPIYHPTSEKKIDLVHTRLEASFDYTKSQLLGKAAITVRPHFYATDSLHLDAKGMTRTFPIAITDSC